MASVSQVKTSVYLTVAVALVMCGTTVVSSLEYGDACQNPPTQTSPAAAAGGAAAGAGAGAQPGQGTPTTGTRADTQTCNATAWLECDGSNCVCKSGMVLGKDRKTCVSVVGQPCNFVESYPGSPIRGCIENAVCIAPDDANNTTSAICECAQLYLPTPGNKSCRPGPGLECARTEDCNTNALLSCQNGRCECDRQESQVWDPIQSKCLSLVGGLCNDGVNAFVKRPCVQNAVCNNSTNRCECKNSTFKETPDKRCLLNYEQVCDAESGDQCHPYYECLPTNATTTATGSKSKGQRKAEIPQAATVTKCLCNKNRTVYDDRFQICAILAGKPCSPSSANSGAAFCVERAVCSERYKECRCEADFIQTSSGQCAGGYRADCNLPSDLCDGDNNLNCTTTDRKCDCMQNFVYSSDSRKCVGYVGTTCARNSDCFELAECRQADKKCQCREGYSATPAPHNRCLLSYGNYCTGPNRCNPFDFLLCDVVNEKCGCESPNSMTLNKETGKCVSHAESHCYTAEISDRKLNCVGNATCQKIEFATNEIGRCKCLDGFQNVEGRCEKITSSSGERFDPGTPQMFILAVLVFFTFDFAKPN